MMRTLSGISLLAFAVAMTGAQKAAAQDNAPTVAPTADTATVVTQAAGEGVQEIIVTAQRRSESLQKTALSIAVVSPTALATAGVTAPVQLTAILPSLQIGNSGPGTSVYLRGVGSYASTAAQSPAVPYYTDGVYVARTQSVQSEFYDVDRLEVLKGPQGTLYGRNASGGAINIITKNPVLGRFEGAVNLEVGNYGNQNGDAAINVPIGDTIALRASGQIVDKGGYSSIGLGDDVHQSGRLKLLWKPSSDVSLLLNGSYGHIGGLGSTWVILDRTVPGWYPWLDTSDKRSQAYLLSHSVFGPNPPPGFLRPTDKSDAKQNLEFYNFSAELNWNLSPNVTLTLIPAYRHSKMQYATLFSFLYSDGYGVGGQPEMPETSSATSVEARLSGTTEKFKWVTGLYYYNEDQFQQYAINGGYPENINTVSRFGTQSYAAFGQATLSVLDHLRLIGGVRYTSDKRSISDGVSYVVSPTVFLGPPPASGVACAFPFTTQVQCAVDAYAGSRTYHNVSWKGGFEADVLGDSLLYATVARGFKAGGYNTQSVTGQPGKALAFLPETLTSYDVGLKNRFFDNRLQLNFEAFYWDYKGHQEPKIGLTNAGITNLIYYNAGSSEIYGANVELIARLWRGGTINGGVEFAHSKYKDFAYDVPTATFDPSRTGCASAPSTTPGSTTLDCSGFETVKTPKWAGSLGFTQEVPLGDGKLIGNANMTFASARWLSIDFTPIERAKAYALVDLSLTYQLPGNRISITVFVRNVNNGEAYTQASQNPFADVTVGNIGSPRSYGARASYKF